MDFTGINYSNYNDLPANHPFWTEYAIAALFDTESLVMTGVSRGTGASMKLSYEMGGQPFFCTATELNPNDWRYDPVTVTMIERDEMGIVIENNIIKNIPIGAWVIVGDTGVTATDSEMLLDVEPGRTLRIRVWHTPFKPFETYYASV